MKILAYLNDLGGGGAERAVITVIGELAKKGIAVVLVVNQRRGELATEIPEQIPIVELSARRTILSLPSLVAAIRRERPSMLLSALTFNHFMAVWASQLSKCGTKVVLWQQVSLSSEAKHQPDWRYRIMIKLARPVFQRAYALAGVSAGVSKELSQIVGRAVEVIHNPIDIHDVLSKKGAGVEHSWFRDSDPIILGVGRLAPQKRFDTLVTAFARVANLRNCRLVILGRGPLKKDLQNHIERLGLTERAQLLDFDQNPWKYMARASVVAMSSEYEGFPLVLLEALACETQVVSTDCPFGPREILDEGRYGWLVPIGDPNAMAAALVESLERPKAKPLLLRRAGEYSSDRIANRFEELFL